MPGIGNFYGKPIGAGPNDFALGEIDGSPIYRTPGGVRYYEQYQPVPPMVPTEALTTTLDDQGRGIHTRAPQERPAGYDMINAVAGEALRGLTAPGRALRGEPVTYGDAWATALDYGVLSAPTSAPEGALRGGGIRAYHGSPHDFDRFSMDKIGTGEGAQAYGHGLYFAESEDVAEQYKRRLAYPRQDNPQTVVERAIDDINYFDGNEDTAVEHWRLDVRDRPDTPAGRSSAEKLAAWESGDVKRTGRMYEVNINANPDDFLDWDAPLSEQPEAVRKALEAGGVSQPYEIVTESGTVLPRTFPRKSDAEALLGDFPGGSVRPVSDATMGRAAYKSAFAEGKISPEEWASTPEGIRHNSDYWASRGLREAGIPGIKYYDGMSRGAGQGTRNYVVFDENLIEIVRKYGIAGAAAYLGMPEDELQQRMGNM